MRVRKIGICRMAHNSSSPVCFWVLGFLLFSFLCLRKPKSPRERAYPSPFISSPLPSLLADPHRSSLSRRFETVFFLSIRNRQISSLFSVFRRISSVPDQIQVFANW